MANSSSAIATFTEDRRTDGELHVDKREVQKQWDRNPCGAESVVDVTPGTLEYYRAVRNHRYTQYAPWMDQTLRFSLWRNLDVLEVGVGLGSDHYRMAVLGNRMTALDLSREHLHHAVKHLRLEGLTTKPHCGDAEQMPFAAESFDRVYSFGAIHHTPNIQRAVSEMHRVLRPDGCALVGVYHRHSIFFWIHTLLGRGIYERQLFRKGYRQLLSEIEFRHADNDACPLVNVYSRNEARRLFAKFSKVEIFSAHVEHSHFNRIHRLFQKCSRETLEQYLGHFGWYLIVRAWK